MRLGVRDKLEELKSKIKNQNQIPVCVSFGLVLILKVFSSLSLFRREGDVKSDRAVRQVLLG
jgi:hypothetical protein